MTLQECEKYIMAKENTIKTIIAKWNYIRYTVFASMFASIERTKKGIVLTVLGRFPQYEKDFACVFPAINNNPTYFSSILIEDALLPDHVIKSVIDSSYYRRLHAVILPQIAKGRDDIPYCGIIQTALYNESVKRNPVPTEIAATTIADNRPTGSFGVNKSLPIPKAEMVGKGNWNDAPYAALSDEKKIRCMIKIQEISKKKGK